MSIELQKFLILRGRRPRGNSFDRQVAQRNKRYRDGKVCLNCCVLLMSDQRQAILSNALSPPQAEAFGLRGGGEKLTYCKVILIEATIACEDLDNVVPRVRCRCSTVSAMS
jgi:hypothetical protein